MLSRWLCALTLMWVAGSLAVAQERPAGEGKPDASEAPAMKALGKKHITPELRKTVEAGLKSLSQMQDPSGAFVKDSRGGVHTEVAIAVTGLSGLAFLAGGSTWDRGPYCLNVQKAATWLLKCQDRNTGYFTTAGDGSRIHGHGYATLFLAQLYGTRGANAELKRSLELAVECISKGQTKDGGWGYVPDDLTFDEGSTTVCCIQALRAASDAGIFVSHKTIQQAVNYLYRSADPRPFTVNGEEFKGFTFKYSLASNWNSDSYAICAAAISSLNGIGVYAEGAVWKEQDVGKVYKGGLDWLRFKLDDFHARKKAGQSALDTSHFHYAHFYAVQAMWNAPEEIYFDEYFPKVRDVLVEEARPEGGWPSVSYGEAYTTSFSLLILLVPYQLLPLFSK